MFARVSTAILALSVCYTSLAYADYSCRGIISESQRNGFEKLLNPPIGPGLRSDAPPSPKQMSKHVNEKQLAELSQPSPKIASSGTLDAKHAKLLKEWLEDSSREPVSGWISSAAGAIPNAWVGLSTEAVTRLLNGIGAESRLAAASVAGTVSEGGKIFATEQITTDAKKVRQYVFIYSYQAVLNGKTITTPLYSCFADVVVDKT